MVDTPKGNTDAHQQSQKNNQTDSVPQHSQKPEPEVEFFSWEAPNRVFKKRNREFFTTIALIVILVSLILFFANQFLPIAVVLSLGFLTYVLASVPPQMIKNKITNYGVYSADYACFWHELGTYWVTKKYGHYVLHIQTSRFPYKMMLLLEDGHKDAVISQVDKYLVEAEPLPNMFDQAVDWMEKNISLDRSTKKSS